MAKSGRRKSDEDGERIVKPSAKIFFVNGQLVRYITSNRGANIVYLYNISEQKDQVMLLSDFKKHRKRAYTITDVGNLLNRTRMQINRYVRDGLIDPPTACTDDGIRRFQYMSYFSEDDVFKIREAMATLHRGRPRKDGRITNSVLTERELRAKMGDVLMLYTRTKDGRFVPVWAEETY